MSKIGTLRKSTEANNNNLFGSIRTLAHSARLVLEPTNRTNEGAPAYVVNALSSDGELIEIGAAWRKETKEKRVYLSMALDDPSWSAPLSCAAFPADKAGEWDVIWNRPERAAA